MVGIRVEAGKTGIGKRHIRRPQHTFHCKTLPYQIQPMLIAPVLPGETMKSLMFQSRVVSDPIINPLVGWWKEYYFFYVKHRDLTIRDDATEMMINPSFDIDASQGRAASAPHYHSTTGVSWVYECLKRVVEEYFRNEGEAWLEWQFSKGDGNLPIASLGRDSVLDSIKFESIEDDVDIDLTDVAGPEGAKVMASEVEAALQQWQFARMNNLTDMTYEDYLKSYGISGQAVEEPHKPELIRFIREWTYPTNTISPTDGAPSSAVSWAIAEKADKDRFFAEPGFIFGVTVTRPKVYLSGLNGNFADQMNSAMTWLPAVLENEVRSGRQSIAGAAAPLVGIAGEAIVDLRDLLIYGDQFLNFNPTSAGYPEVALPEDATLATQINHRYPLIADVKGLFVDFAATDWLIREDGVINLQIATRQRDVSPSSIAVSS